MEGAQRRVARLVRGPPRQRACGTAMDPGKAPEKPIQQVGSLMRDQVVGKAHQMPIQHRHGRTALARGHVGQCGDMRALALIQRHGLRGGEQCLGLRRESRVIRQRQQPGLADMRHREIRRRLARGVEQSDGISMDQDIVTHRLVVQCECLGCGSRYGVSLCVGQHGSLLPVCGGCWAVWRCGATFPVAPDGHNSPRSMR
jgi:hypothetical protein